MIRLRQVGVTYFVILFCLLMSACSTRTRHDFLPGVNTAEARLYIQKCNLCHAPAHPARHTIKEWRSIIVMMEKRMDERGYPQLGAQTKQVILRYLQRHARG